MRVEGLTLPNYGSNGCSHPCTLVTMTSLCLAWPKPGLTVWHSFKIKNCSIHCISVFVSSHALFHEGNALDVRRDLQHLNSLCVVWCFKHRDRLSPLSYTMTYLIAWGILCDTDKRDGTPLSLLMEAWWGVTTQAQDTMKWGPGRDRKEGQVNTGRKAKYKSHIPLVSLLCGWRCWMYNEVYCDLP